MARYDLQTTGLDIEAARIGIVAARFNRDVVDKLLDGARGVVTVNSTVGLWALRAGRPVITLGDAIYDIDGLTFRGGLDAFWTEAGPPERMIAAG